MALFRSKALRRYCVVIDVEHADVREGIDVLMHAVQRIVKGNNLVEVLKADVEHGHMELIVESDKSGPNIPQLEWRVHVKARPV